MREGSHLDGNQTTGYNLHKKIDGLEVFDRIIRCDLPNRCSPQGSSGGPHKRWYVDRQSKRQRRLCGR